MTLRRRLERITKARTTDVWVTDMTDLGDGLSCRRGTDGLPSITRSAFDALPADRERVLIELVDAAPPSPAEGGQW